MFYVAAQENKKTSLEYQESSFWTANKQTNSTQLIFQTSFVLEV